MSESDGLAPLADAVGEEAAEVEVCILGPLRVCVDGTEVTVTAARQRAVITRLALEVGATVSDGQLIEAVWGEEPPASARSTLQTYISNLRRLLGGGTVVRTATGYRLDGVTVDVEKFDAALRRAGALARIEPRADRTDAERIELLTDALALWRGDGIIDGNDDPAVQSGLDERRLNATEELLQLRLERGETTTIIAELEDLCQRHPLRERAACALMVALYRAGRQADALAAERRLRAALLEELGLDPGPEIRDLERRILEQNPDLLFSKHPGDVSEAASSLVGAGTATPAAAWETDDDPGPLRLPVRLTPSQPDSPLVGRRSELDQLGRILDMAADGQQVPVVLLRGEAGIGKTRLAREIALRLATQGQNGASSGASWLVTWGRCPADSGGGFQPCAEAIDHLVRWRPSLAAGLEGLLGSVLPTLARATDPLALLQAGAEQRFAVIDALSEIVARAAAVGPVLMVIDDLHWADPGSTALLEHLAARRLPGVLVLATARNPEPTETAPYIRLLEQLARDHDLTTLDVSGLTEVEVRVLVDRTTDVAAPSEAVTLLHTQTRGNPFFVGEVLAALGSDGVHELESEVPLTVGVQSVLAQRLGHLTSVEEAVLAAAAVIGLEFDLADVAACAEVSTADALTALEHAAAIALIEESANPGSFAFIHALVQGALKSRTPGTRRARLEERAAERRAARTMAEPGALGRRVTSQLLASSDGATDDESSPRPLDERDPLLAMSRATLSRIAAGANPLHDRPGVEIIVASDLTDERAGRTVLRWAEGMLRRGDPGVALARAIEVGELARQLPSAELLVASASVAAEAGGLVAGRETPDLHVELGVLVSDALGVLGGGAESDATRSRLLVHLAMTSDDPEHRRLLANAAGLAAERIGDNRWQAEALLVERGTLWGAGSARERIGLDRRARAIAERVGESGQVAGLLGRIESTLARDLGAAGEIAESRELLDALLERSDMPTVVVGRARLQRAGIDLFEGDINAASAAVQRAVGGDYLRSPRDPHDPLATLLLVVARAEGQLPEARVSLRDANRRWPDNLLWTGALAAAEMDAGEPEPTTTILDGVTELLDASPFGPGAIGGISLLLDAAERLGHPVAVPLRARLAPLAGEFALAGDAGILQQV